MSAKHGELLTAAPQAACAYPGCTATGEVDAFNQRLCYRHFADAWALLENAGAVDGAAITSFASCSAAIQAWLAKQGVRP